MLPPGEQGAKVRPGRLLRGAPRLHAPDRAAAGARRRARGCSRRRGRAVARVPEGADGRRRSRRALRPAAALCPLQRSAEEALGGDALGCAHSLRCSASSSVPYLAISFAVVRVREIAPARPRMLDVRPEAGGSAPAPTPRSSEPRCVSPPPTLFFDEVDNYIGDSSDRAFLIGVLNEGFELDGVVTRVEETAGKREIKDFTVFGAEGLHRALGRSCRRRRSTAASGSSGSSAGCAPSGSPSGASRRVREQARGVVICWPAGLPPPTGRRRRGIRPRILSSPSA